jgi:Fibronectin type III domain
MLICLSGKTTWPLARYSAGALLALIAAAMLAVCTTPVAAGAAGLEDGIINTVYEVPQNASGQKIGYPSAVACDSKGNLYFALTGQYSNSVVMRMDAVTGEVSPYAGNLNVNTAGYGDGGPATDANIKYVLSLAFDSKDNLYIADNGNRKVRVVGADAPHIIETFAGTGVAGAYAGDGGPATEATLVYVFSVKTDADDNLYIGDYGSIRKVDAATGIIKRVAGNGTSAYNMDGVLSSSVPADAALSSQIEDIEFDGTGNMYLCSANQGIVARIDNDLASISVFAGGGADDWGTAPDFIPATQAYLKYPDSLSVDRHDNVYIGLRWMNCIRMVDPQTGEIHTVAGKPGTATGFAGDGGPAKDAEFAMPYDICMDSKGNMYIADALNYRIRKIEGSCPMPTVNLTGAEDGGGHEVNLYWMLDDDGGCNNIEGYTVYRDGTPVATLDGGASSYTDTVPGDCTEYCYAVEAVSGGDTSMSNERCVLMPDETPPQTPSNVTASALDGNDVLLTWDKSADGCEGWASGYVVNMPDGTTVKTSDTTFTVSGLTDCNEYCFTVSAYDSAGNYSGNSETACARTPRVIDCNGTAGHDGGKHTRGSDIPVMFKITDGGAFIGPDKLGGLSVRLFMVSGGGASQLSCAVPGGKDSKFKYKGKGVWMANIKTSSLAPGDYVVTAEPVPAQNCGCSYILLEPAPYFRFSVVEPGGKKK